MTYVFTPAGMFPLWIQPVTGLGDTPQTPNLPAITPFMRAVQS